MALRTINAPGVEIKEIDKSDYSLNLTGSHVLVAGFADRGRDFITQDITSRNTWINLYGEPTNEAERYFYKASMEVINNGGTLHCAKIPYANTISADYIEQVYRVNVEGQPLSADPYLSAVSDIDPSIQKFFLITSDISKDEAQEFADFVKAAYIQHKEEIDAILVDLNNGGSLDSQEAAIEIFNVLMAELDPNPETSRSAKHQNVLKGFDLEESETARAGTIETIKRILYESLKKTIEWDESELRDVQVQWDWLAALKYEFDNAKTIADKSGNKIVKQVVDDFSNNFLAPLDPIKYKVVKAAAKKAAKEATLDEPDITIPDVDVEVESGNDSEQEKIDILIELLSAIPNATKYAHRSSNVFRMTEEDYELFETGEKKPGLGEIRLIDISRTKYGKAIEKRVNDPYMKECLGYMPVITTASNAMYCQQLLNTDIDGAGFNNVSDVRTLNFSEWKGADFPYTESKDNCFVIEDDEMAVPTSVVGTCDESYAQAYRDSLMMRANAYFPALFFDSGTKINREHLKEIGIVVFKTFVNRNDSSKMDFEVVEAFTGSLDPTAVNPSTSASTFIDNIVNNQSEYIRCYSNVVIDNNRAKYNNCDIGYIHNQPAGITGIYAEMMKKTISYSGITSALDKIFDINSDVNAKTIDIVVDAGISNIGQFVSNPMICPDITKGCYYDPTGPDSIYFKMNKSSLTANWKFILEKYDTFCRKTRKDCMFVADAPRPFALVGKKKTVRESRKDTNIDSTIIPLLRYMAAPNSSYGAGYSNWFEETDDFSGNQFWCPPSIRATGVYINCDLNYNYWDAPAGLTRGLISANDVAFNPNIQQAGNIYLKNWNYAIKYPDDGIVLEGQKTFQTRTSAFDRVNVRRLFLRLERYVYRQARYFVYEPNTALTRQRLVDRITPYFNEVQAKGGMYDYRIICDETINTPDVIDNNELRVVIGIKPTKTIEFIIIQFVALRTGGSWEELDHV